MEFTCSFFRRRAIFTRLLVLAIISAWLISGWPPILDLPPKVGVVYADSATKTYTFDADSESWSATACGAAGGSCLWQSSDGSSASGSIEESENRKNKGGTWVWQLSGITWESLGIPPGSTVTAVDGSYNHVMATCVNCNTSGGNTSGDFLIRNSGDSATIATLETAVSYSGATTWANRNASGAQSVGATYQPSNTGILLRLTGGIQMGGTNGSAVIRQDQIALTITYTPPAGTLVTDIVDAGYVSVDIPTMAMDAATFDFVCQTAVGSFGTASQQIYVNNNNGANNGWTLTLAAQSVAGLWDSVGTDYDFNDPTGGGCTDGGDADFVGGQMTVDPSVATLATGQCGSCSTANISKGSAAGFSEGVTDTITLLAATSASDDVGDWRLAGVGISQKIPAEQPAASDYDINMVLTVTVN